MATRGELHLVFLAALFLPCFPALGQRTGSTEFFDKSNFYGDTLFIKARFMECGEWGGHLETTKVFLRGDNFHFSYRKYRTDCSKVNDSNAEPPQILEQSEERRLSDKGKQVIKQYACSLIAAKFKEPATMHAGYIFEMKNKEETINIHVYTWGRTTKNEYLIFIAELLH
ncbi:hypothetical protein V9K67_22615 [Paraflavisolibacter sp. H34]|uniref:hypothetical protein n=1 Tax=Huijunlia imazamoxiresistens TaxID=3127457 RepID=UPI003019A5E0